MSKNLETIKEQLKDTQAILNGLYEELPLITDPEQKVVLKIKISKYETKVSQLKQEVQKSFGLKTSSNNTILLDAASQLSIRKRLPELYLVNCDRQKVYNRFWDSYDDHVERDNPFQFYFMIACPTQQPDSFAERMIYELRKEESDDDPDAVLFKRRSDGKRVAFDELPMGRKLKNAQKAFKSYFSERFALHNANTSFEEYLETGLPALNADYVTLTFDIQSSDWNSKVMNDYFSWLIKEFANTNTKANVPTFWFMFVIFIRNYHENGINKAQQNIITEVKKLVNDHPKECTLISDIKPVPIEFLEDWLLKVDEENSAVKIEGLVNTFISSLPETKQAKYLENKQVDMTDIELLQNIIFELSNK